MDNSPWFIDFPVILQWFSIDINIYLYITIDSHHDTVNLHHGSSKFSSDSPLRSITNTCRWLSFEGGAVALLMAWDHGVTTASAFGVGVKRIVEIFHDSWSFLGMKYTNYINMMKFIKEDWTSTSCIDRLLSFFWNHGLFHSCLHFCLLVSAL